MTNIKHENLFSVNPVNTSLPATQPVEKDEEHRQKLERPDYLASSISNALAYVAGEPTVAIVSDLDLLSRYEFNDYGNGRRLLDLFKGKVLYNPSSGNWLLYEEGRWRPDNKRKEGMLKKANELYCHLSSALQCSYSNMDFDDCEDDASENEESAVEGKEMKREYDRMKKAISRLGDSARQKALLKSAEAECSDATIGFNLHNHLLVVQNGTVDLRTGNLLSHIPEHYITMRSDIRYDSKVPEPKRFLQFLDEVFDHNVELIHYVQRLLGYCLTGETREHVFHVLHGEGANGKSVLINLFQRMFSEYCRSVSSGALAHRADGDKPNPSLLQAKDCRTIIVNETNGGLKLNGALIKQISAGDEICPRTLFEENQNFVPHMKILWITNHIPEIDWQDGGLRRRYRLIPFPVTFGLDQQDRDLPEKLWAEREGILRWLVEGAVAWYNHGLGELPDTMADALEKERRNEDSVYAFFQDEIIKTDVPEDRIQAKSLHDAYLDYCANNEIDYPVTISAFGIKLTKLGITKKKMPGYNVYIGLKLREFEE